MDHGAAKTNRAKTTSGAANKDAAQTGSAKRSSGSGAAIGSAVIVPRSKAKAPPPPPSSRRELPAPTPLVLPTRLQNAAAGQSPQNTSVARSQSAAKQTLARKKAPPPPSSRRARADSNSPAPNRSVTPQPSATNGHLPGDDFKAAGRPRAQPRDSHDTARHADAQWAAHLEAPREIGRARLQQVPDEPPQLPDNLPLLNLEAEISALRPRPSELPPEPQSLGNAASSSTVADCSPETSPSRVNTPSAPAGHRRKNPSELSALYQALPTNYPDRSAGLGAARSSNTARSRGFVPKAPHEFLPPPPPPNKRVASKSFTDEADDEVPTQARRPAVYPYGSATPAPGMVLTPQALRDSTPAPAASMVVPASAPGRGLSPLPPPATMVGTPRLPPPPPLPTGLQTAGRQARDFNADETWEDREWTDAKHLEALQLGALAVHSSHTPAPSAPQTTNVHVDSVHPTAVTVPAPPSVGFPNFGLPRGWAPVAAASVLGAAISAGAFLLPNQGQLLVDVSNQSWASLRDAQVYVNDELVCTHSPCAVKVDAAPQRVRVTAPGYQPSAEDTVIVNEGSVTLHKLQLGASADTGIEIQTALPNLQLYVDGRRIGSLPRKVMGLPPGEHTLVVSGGDNFTTEERRIQLEPNQTLVINDLQLKLKSGSIALLAGDNAAGARVTLDGAEISLPFKGTLEPGRRYSLGATRDGFVPFAQTFEVDPNNPVIELTVSLERDASAVAEAPEGQATASRWARNRWRWQAAQNAKVDTSDADAPASTSGERSISSHSASDTSDADGSAADDSAANDLAADDSALGHSALGAAMRQSVGLPVSDKPAKQQATGTGSINIVTNPPAVILLDGKPVGKTPKRITVSAGTHSLVLIHANGRKRASINVEAGANKTVKASF